MFLSVDGVKISIVLALKQWVRTLIISHVSFPEYFLQNHNNNNNNNNHNNNNNNNNNNNDDESLKHKLMFGRQYDDCCWCLQDIINMENIKFHHGVVFRNRIYAAGKDSLLLWNNVSVKCNRFRSFVCLRSFVR